MKSHDPPAMGKMKSNRSWDGVEGQPQCSITKDHAWRDEQTIGNPAHLGWLNLFNAGLSPERYWRGQRSQGVAEEERELCLYTVTTGMILHFTDLPTCW